MFTILRKRCDERVYDRYFRLWSNARKVMDEEVTNACDFLGGNVIYNKDYFNQDKGIRIYQTTIGFVEDGKGMTITWSLIDGNFNDE